MSLASLANSDVDALIKVLPRMTYPALTEHEIARLDASDLMQFAAEVIGFVTIFGSLTFPAKLSVDDLMADIAVIFTGRHQSCIPERDRAPHMARQGATAKRKPL